MGSKLTDWGFLWYGAEYALSRDAKNQLRGVLRHVLAAHRHPYGFVEVRLAHVDLPTELHVQARLVTGLGRELVHRAILDIPDYPRAGLSDAQVAELFHRLEVPTP